MNCVWCGRVVDVFENRDVQDSLIGLLGEVCDNEVHIDLAEYLADTAPREYTPENLNANGDLVSCARCVMRHLGERYREVAGPIN